MLFTGRESGTPSRPMRQSALLGLDEDGDAAGRRRNGGHHMGLHKVVTPHVKLQWLRGAELLACAQDMIILEGPAKFVRNCLATKRMTRHNTIRGHIGALIFVVVIPYCLPAYFAQMNMSYYWDEFSVDPQHSEFSTPEDVFGLGNAKVNLAMLRADLRNHSMPSSSKGVLYLSSQVLQASVKKPMVQFITGSTALLIIAVTYTIVRTCAQYRVVKLCIIHWAMHNQWYNFSDRLKYTDQEFFWRRVRLQDLLPCAWLAVVLSFVVVIPVEVCLLAVNTIEAVWIVPRGIVAAWVIGKLYLQLVTFTSSVWLFVQTSPINLVARQLQTEMGGMFMKLADNRWSYDTISITCKEMEQIQTIRALELWLLVRSCEHSSHSGVREFGACLREPLENNQWEQVDAVLRPRGGQREQVSRRGNSFFGYRAASRHHHNTQLEEWGSTIATWLSEQKGKAMRDAHGYKNIEQQEIFDEQVREGKHNFLKECLLNQVFVPNYETDTLYVIDLKTGAGTVKVAPN